MTNSKLLLLVLFGAAACSSQVDSTHQGTALAKLAGTVRNTRTKAIPDSEVVVLWQKSSGSPDLVGSESVAVSGDFPAQFHLSIYTPPDPTLLNEWHGVKVGVAYIIAGVPGTDYSDDHTAERGLLGMEIDHLLVYVPQDVPAGSDASYLLHSTPTTGFHIYGVGRLSQAEKDQRQACINALPDATIQAIYTQCGGDPVFDDFVPLDSDLSTPLDINLVDDPSTIDIPNWT